MRSLLPFAVVGSNATLTEEDGTKYRGREYPWGTVNIEDQVGHGADANGNTKQYRDTVTSHH